LTNVFLGLTPQALCCRLRCRLNAKSYWPLKRFLEFERVYLNSVEWKIENATSLRESEGGKAATRNQQIGALLSLTLLLALALYRRTG